MHVWIANYATVDDKRAEDAAAEWARNAPLVDYAAPQLIDVFLNADNLVQLKREIETEQEAVLEGDEPFDREHNWERNHEDDALVVWLHYINGDVHGALVLRRHDVTPTSGPARFPTLEETWRDEDED